MKRYFKDKKCLVTGSEGFVGRALVKRLEREGAGISVADRKLGIDVTKGRNLDRFKDIDVVFHLAAVLRGAGDKKIVSDNVKGAKNVLELCRRTGAGLVYFSSFVYGKPRYLPIDESHPVRPVTAYSKSKAMGEELCRSYNRRFGVKSVILRPFNIYGPGQGVDFVIPSIIRQALRGDGISLEGADSRRDFVYIDDVIDACLKAASYYGHGIEVFNIGSGSSIKISAIADIISKVLGRNISIRFAKRLSEEKVKNTVADIAKAEKYLNWKPACGMRKGVLSILRKDGAVCKRIKSF